MNWFEALSLFVKLWPIIQEILDSMDPKDKDEVVAMAKELIAERDRKKGVA